LGIAERGARQSIFEALSQKQFHHDKELAIEFSKVVNLNGPRMSKRGQDMCFTFETLTHLWAIVAAGFKHLDGNAAKQTGLGGSIDRTHAALAKFFVYAVATCDHVARLKFFCH